MFVDTSVLLNIMGVPKCGNTAEQAADRERFAVLTRAGACLILPVTCLIEAGNAVAKVSGPDKHRVQATYLRFVRATVQDEAPWALSGVALDLGLLGTILDGSTVVPTLSHLLSSGVGTGDAAILHEARQYLTRVSVPSGTPVRIWTHDRALDAWNH